MIFKDARKEFKIKDFMPWRTNLIYILVIFFLIFSIVNLGFYKNHVDTINAIAYTKSNYKKIFNEKKKVDNIANSYNNISSNKIKSEKFDEISKEYEKMSKNVDKMDFQNKKVAKLSQKLNENKDKADDSSSTANEKDAFGL